jgi:D-arginine dehydrogenase
MMFTKKNKTFDVIVIGSGIAGISIASKLSNDLSVCVIEKEKLLSYHSTGRSFAFYIESYGNETIRKLTKASRQFFISNDNLKNRRLLNKRGALYLANDNQLNSKNILFNELNSSLIKTLDKQETINKLPCLNENYVNSSLYDSDASDIDVDLLYNIFLKNFKNTKGVVITDIEILNFKKNKTNWEIKTNKDTLSCKIIVNAAGAWADQIAKKINAKTINLIPKRRTVFCFKPLNLEINKNWPLCVDVDEKFYFKSENNIILASPADETPSIAEDCHPDELDIAIGIDRINKATEFKFKNIINKWAGLRNFVYDKTPVIGFDRNIEDFYWLSGQGGYGIQTSPALSDIAANEILNKNNNYFFHQLEIDSKLLSINRF